MLSLRRLTPPALAGLLTLAGLAHAGEPAPARRTVTVPASNQQLADSVAQQLRASGQLRHYRVEVTSSDGVVALDGFVNDMTQRDEAARLAQSVPGVGRVMNRLKVGQNPVTTAQYAAPAPHPAGYGHPKANGHLHNGGAMPGGDPGSGYPGAAGYSGAGSIFSEPPPLPPYAWPTFAPYNNFSRVAYPNAYPYEAFPHIGPPYPFPKVPLGWRAVKLQWDDGHWWLSTHGIKHDWWVLRYW